MLSVVVARESLPIATVLFADVVLFVPNEILSTAFVSANASTPIAIERSAFVCEPCKRAALYAPVATAPFLS